MKQQKRMELMLNYMDKEFNKLKEKELKIFNERVLKGIEKIKKDVYRKFAKSKRVK